MSNVDLKPTAELGHLAHDRALVSSKAPSLATLVAVMFPGVELEGKEGGPNCPYPHTSNWAAGLGIDDTAETICIR